MGNFKKKPIVIEAITFAEFVKYGIENGANIVNDMPWSFNYKKHPVTHESDECYLVPTHQGIVKFTPADMLITQIDGEIYPCKIELFEATYDLVEKESEMTFEEAEKWLEKDLCIALPEWGGFWFKNIKNCEILVLTKEGEITNTPFDEFKERNDWKVVKATDDQLKIISDYFISKAELSFGQKAVGLSFNPSGDYSVHTAKTLSASLIDLLEAKHNEVTDNGKAMASWTRNVFRTAAFNAIISAQMLVVKYLTFRD